ENRYGEIVKVGWGTLVEMRHLSKQNRAAKREITISKRLARKVVKRGENWLKMKHFSTRQCIRPTNASTPASFVTPLTRKIQSPFPRAGGAVTPRNSSFFRKRLTNFFWSCRLKNFLV